MAAADPQVLEAVGRGNPVVFMDISIAGKYVYVLCDHTHDCLCPRVCVCMHRLGRQRHQRSTPDQSVYVPGIDAGWGARKIDACRHACHPPTDSQNHSIAGMPATHHYATTLSPTADRPAGRIKMELFKDVCPKTVENFRQFCTGNNEMDKKKDEGGRGGVYPCMGVRECMYVCMRLSRWITPPP